MPDLIRIRTEPCSICEKTLALSLSAEELQPDITGLDLFLDLHGINEEQPHARLLYIDANGFVRTITLVTKFTTTLHDTPPPEDTG
ncbi:MAG: hypothetical protein ACW991_09905 [Candidatus Hodarchaeales archaeon]|jgi:hypothetical protein